MAVPSRARRPSAAWSALERALLARREWLVPALVVAWFWGFGAVALGRGFTNFGADDWMRVHTSYRVLRDPLLFVRGEGLPFGPLYFFIYGVAGELLGRDFERIRWFTALLAGASIVLFHLLLRRAFAFPVAAAALLCAFFTPSGVQLAVSPLTTYSALVLFLGGLLLTVATAAEAEPGRRGIARLVAAAVLLAGAGFIRFEMMFFSGLAGLWLLATVGRRWGWARTARIVALLGAIAWTPAAYLLARSWIALGSPLGFWQKQVEWGEYMQPEEERLTYWASHFLDDFLARQVPGLGLLVGAALLSLLGAVATRRGRRALRRLSPEAVLLLGLGLAYPVFLVLFFAKAFSAAMIDSYAYPAVVMLAPWVAWGVFALLGASPGRVAARGGRLDPSTSALALLLVAGLLAANLEVGLRNPANPHQGRNLHELIRAAERLRPQLGGTLSLVHESEEGAGGRWKANFLLAHLRRGDHHAEVAEKGFAEWARAAAAGPPDDRPDVVLTRSAAADLALLTLFRDSHRPALEVESPVYRAWLRWAPGAVAGVLPEVAAGQAAPSVALDPSGRCVWVAWPAGLVSDGGAPRLRQWRQPDLGWRRALTDDEEARLHFFHRFGARGPAREGAAAASLLLLPPFVPPGGSALDFELPGRAERVAVALAIPTPLGERWEASAFHRPSGQPTRRGWSIWSNFSLSRWVVPGRRIAAVRIEAAGDPCDGVWPLMQVKWRGEVVATVPVNSPEVRPYDIAVAMEAGEVGLLEIGMTNNAENRATGEDRNLVIRSVELRPARQR